MREAYFFDNENQEKILNCIIKNEDREEALEIKTYSRNNMVCKEKYNYF